MSAPDAPFADRRINVQRPEHFAARLNETLVALEILTTPENAPLGAAGLRAFYPSPAALQLYLLNDPQVLGALAEYRNAPRDTADGLRAMLHGLENASEWLGDELDDSRDQKFGMRGKYPRIRELVTYFAAYELQAMRRNHELTNKRMRAVFQVWERAAGDSEDRRQLTKWENSLFAWRKNYKAAVSRSASVATIDRHKLEVRTLIAAFRPEVYVRIFLVAVAETRDGPLAPLTAPHRVIAMGDTRSEVVSHALQALTHGRVTTVKLEPPPEVRRQPPPASGGASNAETGDDALLIDTAMFGGGGGGGGGGP